MSGFSRTVNCPHEPGASPACSHSVGVALARAADSVVAQPVMNLQVPPELEAKLTRLAAETGRTVDQVALDLLASSVDHDEWFRPRSKRVARRP